MMREAEPLVSLLAGGSKAPRKNGAYRSLLGGESGFTPIERAVMEAIMNDLSPETIIEIGTGHGYTSAWLALQAFVREADFHTFEIRPSLRRVNPIAAIGTLGGRIHTGDVFSEEMTNRIERILHLPGSAFVVMDGGEKPAELREFGPLMKVGDVCLVDDWGDEVTPPDLKDWLPESGLNFYREVRPGTWFQDLLTYTKVEVFIKMEEPE